MRYAVSYGNGNDGLSRLHCAFTVEAPEGSDALIAKLAMLSQFTSTGRRYVSANLSIDEAGSDASQAVVYDPPRSPGWSDHNGAWKLAEAYPASEITNGDDVTAYASLEAAFGRQLVVAHRMVVQPVQQAQANAATLSAPEHAVRVTVYNSCNGKQLQQTGPDPVAAYDAVEALSVWGLDSHARRAFNEAWSICSEQTRVSVTRQHMTVTIEQVDTARQFDSLDSFTQGYITALFWTEEDRLEEEGCKNAGPGDMLPDFLAACVKDCARFQADNAADLAAAEEAGRDAEHLGHDFWLTRNGHGTGFWDRRELEAGGLGDRLSEAARRFGTVDVGTDGNGRVCS